VRKGLKKLRHGVEFVAAFYPRKAVKRYLRQLKGLQKSLGVINDAAVAIRLAEDLANGDRTKLGTPGGARGESSARESGCEARARATVGAFRRQDPFWR
jgi:CHAD domain-containing protein